MDQLERLDEPTLNLVLSSLGPCDLLSVAQTCSRARHTVAAMAQATERDVASCVAALWRKREDPFSGALVELIQRDSWLACHQLLSSRRCIVACFHAAWLQHGDKTACEDSFSEGHGAAASRRQAEADTGRPQPPPPPAAAAAAAAPLSCRACSSSGVDAADAAAGFRSFYDRMLKPHVDAGAWRECLDQFGPTQTRLARPDAALSSIMPAMLPSFLGHGHCPLRILWCNGLYHYWDNRWYLLEAAIGSGRLYVGQVLLAAIREPCVAEVRRLLLSSRRPGGEPAPPPPHGAARWLPALLARCLAWCAAREQPEEEPGGERVRAAAAAATAEEEETDARRDRRSLAAWLLGRALPAEMRTCLTAALSAAAAAAADSGGGLRRRLCRQLLECGACPTLGQLHDAAAAGDAALCRLLLDWQYAEELPFHLRHDWVGPCSITDLPPPKPWYSPVTFVRLDVRRQPRLLEAARRAGHAAVVAVLLEYGAVQDKGGGGGGGAAEDAPLLSGAR